MNQSASEASVEAVHVLIIEGDPAVSHVLQASLMFGGFTSEAFDSAWEALERLNTGRFSAMLLDVSSLDLDGVQLIKTIRSRYEIPIIVTSDRAFEDDVVTALDAGAEDFVAKPFRPRELLARVRAVLRRGRSFNAEVTEPSERTGRQGFKEHKLSRQEIKLLDFLQSRSGEFATTEEIVQSVWGSGADRGNAHVRVLVATLRRKLKLAGDPNQILNQRGLGYRLYRI